MTRSLRLITSCVIAAATTAAATGLATAATSSAAARTASGTQRLVLYTGNARGTDAPVVVEAIGPISGIGSETQTDTQSKQGEVNRVTLRFKGGTISLLAPETFAWKPNLSTCSAVATGHGTWKITKATGVYAGVNGHGDFKVHGVLLGARNRAGSCLGERAQPLVNYVTVVLTGTVNR